MNKTVLVTGTSREIGRAIASKFLENGDIVYGTYYHSKNQIQELYDKYGDNFKICGSYNFSNLDDTNAFVDSFSDSDHLGYIVDNEMLVDQLLEGYNVLLNAVKDNKLKQYNVKE